MTNEQLQYEYVAWMHEHVHADVIRVLRDTVGLLEYASGSILDEYTNELDSIRDAGLCMQYNSVDIQDDQRAELYAHGGTDPMHDDDVDVRNFKTTIAQYAAIRDNLSELDRAILETLPDVWGIVDCARDDSDEYFNRMIYQSLIDVAVIVHIRVTA